MDTLTNERLEREFKVTKKTLDNIEIKINKNNKLYDNALHFIDTSKRYYKDAKYFKDKGDKASAFGALNYAFGWLDAGKNIGLFKGKK
ncbi:MAG: DUF357 domain-containing protein [Candidatus Woesearchaeota archaeon]|jgi:hypothetical protein|nr:DUF357 domain-containing protein [Candidatus Woesearchaeota archaeon]|tara:strand:+ start:4777 stop:5040 length:264 start_codon:yes stop_codon:yes gene_type:complete